MPSNCGAGEDSWVLWTARRSNQSLEGLMLKLKLQYFGHLMPTANSLEKFLMLGKIEGKRRRRHQMMRWLHGITDAMDIKLTNSRRWWRTGMLGVLQSIELVMPSNHLILCHPLLLPSIFSRVFSNELAVHIRWPKCLSFSFTIRPYHQYSEVTSFRINWFDLLLVQGILKGLFQHHSSKASILHHSSFFMV